MSEAVDPVELRARGSLKWTNFEQGVLPAWVAEMDFGLAPAISEALHDAVDRGDTAYFYPELERRTAEAATSFWARRFGWEVSSGNVFSTPDVVEGIRRAIIHLTEPGSPVILHTPVYYPFFSMIERAGRSLIAVPSSRSKEGVYSIDLDLVSQAFAAGAGSIVLCNPWNPTGKCFSETEISDLLHIAARHGARVISDEIHAPLTYDDASHVVAATIDADTVVTVTSASKAWNLPGLKCAQVVLTNEDDLAKWSSYYTLDKIGVGTFGLIANAAAYAAGEVWLAGVMDLLHQNRRVLGQLIDEHLPDVGYVDPQATYLAWLDFTAYGLDDPAAYLLDNAQVALTGGDPFGIGGKGHARINFATYEPILHEIIERIGKTL